MKLVLISDHSPMDDDYPSARIGTIWFNVVEKHAFTKDDTCWRNMTTGLLYRYERKFITLSSEIMGYGVCAFTNEYGLDKVTMPVSGYNEYDFPIDLTKNVIILARI